MLHQTFEYFATDRSYTNRAFWWVRQLLWTCCWCWFLTSLESSTAHAQDKLKKLKEGEQQVRQTQYRCRGDRDHRYPSALEKK